MKVTTEFLPDHPILILRAAETDRSLGMFHGEPIAFRCVECGVADETATEMIHEEDCRLQGQTKPTAYADRITSFDERPEVTVATDGGPTQ